MEGPGSAPAGEAHATRTLFTYGSLATLGGSSLATALLLRVAAQIPALRLVPCGLLGWGLAVAVLALGFGFQGDLHPGTLPLLALNGLLAASTAVGASHIADRATPQGRGDER